MIEEYCFFITFKNSRKWVSPIKIIFFLEILLHIIFVPSKKNHPKFTGPAKKIDKNSNNRETQLGKISEKGAPPP